MPFKLTFLPALVSLFTISPALEAWAYQIGARETSFVGTNSTTAPRVQWTRDRFEANGSAEIRVESDGGMGIMSGFVSLYRPRGNQSSFTSGAHPFVASIDERIEPITPVPPGGIVRLTMSAHYTGEASRTPPSPNGNPGSAFVAFNFRLGAFDSGTMLGISRLNDAHVWSTSTNRDMAAVQSEFNVSGGKITSLRLALRRGNSTQPHYYFFSSINGEARVGTDAGSAVSIGRMQVFFMLEASTNNGVTYTPVPWKSNHTNFLNRVPPRLTLDRTANSRLWVTGLPLSRHLLQVAPSPLGPWNDFGTEFILPDLEPLEITDIATDPIRFYRTISP
jgi:hypothetical protein